MTNKEDTGARAIKGIWLVCGFSQNLSSTKDPDLPDQKDTNITGTDATTKAQRKAVKSNVMAMRNFTMGFTADGLIGMIYGAITTKWPTEKACLVVVALHNKYAPKDLVSKITTVLNKAPVEYSR
eukprot:9395244-Ditylum_brightwellii.AAC.1